MDWKERYAAKLRTPQDAVKVIRSGDLVRFTLQSPLQTCWSLGQALAKRAPELENCTLDVTFSLVSELGLLAPGTEKSWDVFTGFAMGPTEIAKLNELDERVNLVPFYSSHLPLAGGPFRDDFRKRWVESDVCMAMVSPPDKHGYVTFGSQLILARKHIRNARIAIGEVNDKMPVIPGGDNLMHVDEFDYLVESTPWEFLPILMERMLEPTPLEEQEPSEVVCALIAEMVNDGDCLMTGGGAMPMRLGPFLENKVDLGCHTEIIMPLDLMRKGVVNNRRRNLVPGKTSLTAMMATSPEDEAFIDGNPNFDMRDMDLNNDPAYFSRNDNIVAVNAPLEVSLFGEIGIERIGRRYFRGVGGQVEMVIGALMAKNGRSIHGMVSRKLTSRGEWMSKIVPQLTPPSIASIPRQCADFIITEYGVASLQGKTEREIANELIAISHPDFRAELRKEAQKLLYA